MSNLEFLQDLIKKNYIAIIAIAFGVVSIISSSLYVYYSKEECPICEEVIDDKVEAIEPQEAVPVSTLKVDIKGAVKTPGVYELMTGKNISDAIKLAGGITSKGTTSNINLSRKLTDEMVIYVFTKEELEQNSSSNEVVCEIPKCECETIKIEQNIDNANKNEPSSTKGKISINKATLEELSSLDGIGESKAKAIIEYREANGPFKTIEEVMNVSGIKETAFNKIKDYITI